MKRRGGSRARPLLLQPVEALENKRQRVHDCPDDSDLLLLQEPYNRNTREQGKHHGEGGCEEEETSQHQIELELKEKLELAERRLQELEEESFTLKAELMCKAAEEKHGKSQLIQSLESRLAFKQRELEESDSALVAERRIRQQLQHQNNLLLQRRTAQQQQAHRETASELRREKKARLERRSSAASSSSSTSSSASSTLAATGKDLGEKSQQRNSRVELPDWIAAEDFVTLLQVVGPQNGTAIAEGDAETVLISELSLRLDQVGTLQDSVSITCKHQGGDDWAEDSGALSILLRLLNNCFQKQPISLESSISSTLFVPLLERSLPQLEPLQAKHKTAGNSSITKTDSPLFSKRTRKQSTETPRKHVVKTTPSQVPHLKLNHGESSCASSTSPNQSRNVAENDASLHLLYFLRPALIDILKLFARNTVRPTDSGQRVFDILAGVLSQLATDSLSLCSLSSASSCSVSLSTYPASTSTSSTRGTRTKSVIDDNANHDKSIHKQQTEEQKEESDEDDGNVVLIRDMCRCCNQCLQKAMESRAKQVLELMAVVASTQLVRQNQLVDFSRLFRQRSEDPADVAWNSAVLHLCLSIYISNPLLLIRSETSNALMNVLHQLGHDMPPAAALADTLSRQVTALDIGEPPSTTSTSSN